MTAATLTPRARRELLAAVRWIATDDPVAADALLEAVDKTCQRLGQYPDFVGSVPTWLVRNIASSH